MNKTRILYSVIEILKLSIGKKRQVILIILCHLGRMGRKLTGNNAATFAFKLLILTYSSKQHGNNELRESKDVSSMEICILVCSMKEHPLLFLVNRSKSPDTSKQNLSYRKDWEKSSVLTHRYLQTLSREFRHSSLLGKTRYASWELLGYGRKNTFALANSSCPRLEPFLQQNINFCMQN